MIQLKGREMKSFLKYFWFDVVFALFAYTTLFLYTGNSFESMEIAIFLTILEISLSFDNAVVNSRKIKEMNGFWKMMFLTVGMFVAVGVVRFWLPLEIVSDIGHMTLKDALHMALNDHERFKDILLQSKHVIAGAGGAFLGLLAIEFFMNSEKETHWLPVIEVPLQKLKVFLEAVKFESFGAIIILIGSYLVSLKIEDISVFYASIGGVAAFIVVEVIKNALELADEYLQESKWAFLTGGFGAFLTTELIDASCSADGVVAAIAMSGDVLIVTAGLSVGALAIRSLTIKLVEENTLAELEYLENGAFLSILALAVSMYVGLFVEIPE